MKRDNILHFPQPGHALSPEEFASRLTELTVELDTKLSRDGEGCSQDLARIEDVSILLKKISVLVSRGRDRVSVAETFSRVMLSTAELRSKLRNEA